MRYQVEGLRRFTAPPLSVLAPFLSASKEVSCRLLFLAFFLSIQSAREEPFVVFDEMSNDSNNFMIAGCTSMTSSTQWMAFSRFSSSTMASQEGKQSLSTVLTIVKRNSRSTCASPLDGKSGRYLRIEGFVIQKSSTFCKVSCLYLGTFTLLTQSLVKKSLRPLRTALKYSIVQQRRSGRKNYPVSISIYQTKSLRANLPLTPSAQSRLCLD